MAAFSCGLGFLETLVGELVEAHLVDQHEVVLLDLGCLGEALFLLLEPELFFLLALALLGKSLLLSSDGFAFGLAFPVLGPALDLWHLVDADGRGVSLEEWPLVVLQDPVSGLFGESDFAVRWGLILLAHSLDLVVVDTSIGVLGGLPEGGETDNDLRHFQTGLQDSG